MSKWVDHTGCRFFNYVIKEQINTRITKVTNKIYNQWKALCDCGREFILTTKQVKRGQKSCGCLRLVGDFRKILTDDQASLRKIIYRYQRSAKVRNLEYSLTEEEAFTFFKTNCFYCDTPPSNITPDLRYCTKKLYSGIDRVNNKLGYFKNNCVSCCKLCNHAKLDLTLEEFYDWIKRVKIKLESNT